MKINFLENAKEKARKLYKTIPAVFLCIKDRETPVIAKILAVIAVVYTLSPIDLIPDFIPILGYLDDVIIIPALITLIIKLIPPNVWERSLSKSQSLWQEGMPKKWYYALPIIVFWLIIIKLIVK